ncbi:MAG: dihydroorotase family protein [Candidatus Bathyarchaeia archaeon]
MIADVVLVNTKAYMNLAIVDCSVAIDDSRILKIGRETNMPKSDVRLDLKNLLVLPGLIDVHVHLRDEEKAYKEDFYSGTAAAAAGGMTTALDMPNNNPVTMSVETLRNRMGLAERKVLVNVGFYSEFPKDKSEIQAIVREGAVGFKLYMAEQVGGLDIRNDQAIMEAFKVAGSLGILTATHAEDEQTLKRNEDKFKSIGRNDINAFLKAHSEDVEVKAIERLLKLAKQTGMHLHFCHVSTEAGMTKIIEAKKSELQVTCEATPHHLFLSVRDLKRIGSLALTMPPLRDRRDVDGLWEAVKNGWVDVIGSDHAPHTLKEKEAESVWDVKVGIPGLETTLPLLLTEVRRGRISIGDVVRLMSENPAEIFKLKNKGRLKEGNDADLTVVDLNRKYKIDASKFHSKAKFSPFEGREVQGKPVKTIVAGQLVMDDGEIVAKAGSGRIIRRE